jgi:hypothetical protein
MKYRIIVRRLAGRDLEDGGDWYTGQQSDLGTWPDSRLMTNVRDRTWVEVGSGTARLPAGVRL